MDSFPQLSLDQLAHLLSHVDIKPRLSSCSLVSSSWCTAAARATTSIKVDDRTPLNSFKDWLWAHTAKVQVSSLTVYGEHPTFFTDFSQVQLRLPTAQLHSLKELDLQSLCWSSETAAPPQQASGSTSSSSTRASKQGLAGLTALTSLTLSGTSVRLAGLSALTGLQELSCELPTGMFVNILTLSRGGFRVADTEAALVAAFPHLQCLTRLTRLTLSVRIASTGVVSQLSTLQSLQKLKVSYPTADSFAALPQSLTQLSIVFWPAGSLTASNAAGLLQLPALQVLHLQLARPLGVGLLAGMRNLRSLQLLECTLVAGDSQQQGASSLSALTSLAISNAPAGPDSTAAVGDTPTPAGQLAMLPQANTSVFPAGLQFQHLTELVVSTYPLENLLAVRHVGDCSPNLKSLTLKQAMQRTSDTLQDPQAALVAGSFAAMSAWSSLRELRLAYIWPQLPPAAWQALGTLSQLTALHTEVWRGPTREDVLPLTGCTALQALDIYGAQDTKMVKLNLNSTAPAGQPPDVWRRLPEELHDWGSNPGA